MKPKEGRQDGRRNEDPFIFNHPSHRPETQLSNRQTNGRVKHPSVCSFYLSVTSSPRRVKR